MVKVTKAELVTAGSKVTEWTERRNALIVKAYREQQMSVPEIAEAVGLSRPGAYKIIHAAAK